MNAATLPAPPAPVKTARITEAIFRLQNGEPPELAKAARAANMSPSHFQREFKRWVGVSPKQFSSALTLSGVKQRLAAGENVLNAALDAGLSGGGRAHDLFVGFEAATPGDFQNGGERMHIRRGEAQTFFGAVHVAQTSRGVCLLRFADSTRADEENSALFRKELSRRWPRAKTTTDNKAAAKIADAMFDDAAAKRTPLAVTGTNFQINVWRALLAIPSGYAVCYGALARALGYKGAAQAVGRAAGANPVAVLIPCHRLLAANGALTGYAWGLERKRALLAREFCR